MKKIWLVALISIVMGAISCSKEDEPGNGEEINVSGVTLDKTSVSLLINEELTLVATISPTEASGVKANWKSSDYQIATVSGEGKIRGVKKGTAVITVTVGNKLANCSVTVTENQTTTLDIDKTSMTFVATTPPSQSFNITSNSAWTAASSETWCKVDKTSGTGNTAITVTASAYSGSESRKATITVQGGSITKTIIVTQEAVPAVSANVGDYFYSDGTSSSTHNPQKECIGIVFREKTETQKGLIVSLDEGRALVWGMSSSPYERALSSDDGEKNTAEIYAAYTDPDFYMWDYFKAFKWCVEKGDGWYLPAKNELQELYMAWNKATSVNHINQAERDAFNAKLTTIGKTPLASYTNNSYYWSSTYFTATKAYYVNFASVGTAFTAFNTSANVVRAVRKF